LVVQPLQISPIFVVMPSGGHRQSVAGGFSPTAPSIVASSGEDELEIHGSRFHPDLASVVPKRIDRLNKVIHS